MKSRNLLGVILIAFFLSVVSVSASPVVSNIVIIPNETNANPILTATLTDSFLDVINGSYFIGNSSWNSSIFYLNPNDGAFDGLNENVNATINISSIADGNYIVYVRGQSNDSVWGANYSSTLKIDRVAPSLTNSSFSGAHFNGTDYFFSPANGDGNYDSLNIIMNASELVKDWGTTKIYNFSGDWIKNLNSPPGSPDNIYSFIKSWDGTTNGGTIAPDGLYTINTTITDTAGNSNTLLVGNVYIDNTPPSTTDNAPNGWITSSSFNLGFSAVDSSGSGVKYTEYSLDNGASWTQGNSVLISTEGNHKILYRSVDNVGNIELSKTTYVAIDSQNPSVSITSPAENSLWGGTLGKRFINFLTTVSDSTSGILSVFFRITNSTYSEDVSLSAAGNQYSNTTYDSRNLADGDYNATVYASDIAGNQNNTERVSFTVDNTGPAINVVGISPPNGSIYNDNDVTINFTITDPSNVNGNSIRFESDFSGSSINYSLSSNPIRIDDLGNGNYSIVIPNTYLENNETVSYRIYAEDTLGNPSLTSSDSFFISNRDPVFNVSKLPLPNFVWVEDQGYGRINISDYFYDLDGDVLNYSAVFNDSNLYFDFDTNGDMLLHSATNWNGWASVQFRADDPYGGVNYSGWTTIFVDSDINEVPTLNINPTPINFSEDSSLTLDLICNPNDPFQSCENFSFDSSYPVYNPNLSISIIQTSPTNAQVILTPAQDWFGVTYVKFSVQDNGNPIQTGYLVSEINITPVNDAPVLTIPDVNVNEDNSTPVRIDLSEYYRDVDNQLSELTFGLVSETNTTLIDCSLSGTIISCSAPLQNAYGTSTVTVNVSDGQLTTTESFNINVLPVNDAPMITSTPPTSATEDSYYRYQVIASDVENDQLTYSLIEAPNNMAIDPISGEILWLPLNEHVGSNTVEIMVSDGNGGNATQRFTINVVNTNDAPVLNPIGTQNLQEGTFYSYTVSASDDDLIYGDRLTFLSNDSLIGIDSSSGLVSFTPSSSNIGLHYVLITVTDNSGASDSEIVLFNISAQDRPRITSVTPNYNDPKIPEDGKITLQVDYSYGNSIPSVQWYVDGSLVLAGSNSYTYSPNGILTRNVEVIVSDGTNSDSYTWTITSSNRPIANSFTGPTTTDFSRFNETELSAIKDVTLENSFGKIDWDSVLDMRDVVDLDNAVVIRQGLVSVDTRLYPPLNKPAVITLKNMSFSGNPKILYTSEFTTNTDSIINECTFCNILSNKDGELVFEVEKLGSFRVIDSDSPSVPLEAFGVDECVSGIKGNLIMDIDRPIEDKEFSPEDKIKTRINIENNNSERKKIILKSYIYDIDSEEIIDSDRVSKTLNSYESDNFKTEMFVPEDIDSSDRYILFVKAYESGKEDYACVQNSTDLNINRKDVDLQIENVLMSKQKIAKGEVLEIKVFVKNKGDSESLDNYVVVRSPTIGFSKVGERFDLEEYGQNDKFTQTFRIEIPMLAPEGSHELTIKAISEEGESIEKKNITITNEVVPKEFSPSDMITANKDIEKIVNSESHKSNTKGILSRSLFSSKKDEKYIPVVIVLTILIFIISIIMLIYVLKKR